MKRVAPDEVGAVTYDAASDSFTVEYVGQGRRGRLTFANRVSAKSGGPSSRLPETTCEASARATAQKVLDEARRGFALTARPYTPPKPDAWEKPLPGEPCPRSLTGWHVLRFAHGKLSCREIGDGHEYRKGRDGCRGFHYGSRCACGITNHVLDRQREESRGR